MTFHSGYFDMSIIRCGLIELLSQLRRDLCVPEGAHGFYHHFVSILADGYRRLGDIAHLSGGKTDTCCKNKSKEKK